MSRLTSFVLTITGLALTGCTSDVASQSQDQREAQCRAGVSCVTSFPHHVSETTVGGRHLLDRYSCAPDIDESGAERIYHVILPRRALLTAAVEAHPGVDVDVHILQYLDEDSCIDRGHTKTAALLDPGSYFVVVDSFVDQNGVSKEGGFDLTIGATSAVDHVGAGLDSEVLAAALLTFDAAWAQGDTEHFEYGVIDYTLPSVRPRFFVLDLLRNEVLFSELTTHGINSGDPEDLTLTAATGNVPESKMSSVGLVKGAETYDGEYGHSLRLDGLEPGFNDNDRSRAIVIHKADYATSDFVATNGFLGRSWGCPAIDPDIHVDLIDTLAEGRLILKYFDDGDWLRDSTYLHGR